MRTALFWAITQRVVVTPYRRFKTTYRSHTEGTKIKERVVVTPYRRFKTTYRSHTEGTKIQERVVVIS